MSDAIARVTRTGGEAVEKLRQFNRESEAAKRNTADMSEALADFQRRRDQFERMRGAGRGLTPDELSQYGGRYSQEQLARARMIRPAGGGAERILIPKPVDYSNLSDTHLHALTRDLGRKRLEVDRDLARAGGATPEERTKLRQAIEKADPSIRQVSEQYGEALAELERRKARPRASSTGGVDAGRLRRLGYDDDEIGRSRPLSPGGPVIIGAPPVPTRPEGPPIPEPFTGTPATRRRRETAESGSQAAAAVESEARAHQKARREIDFTGLSERRLRYEWQQNVAELRTQQREIDRVTNRYEGLRQKKRSLTLDDREELARLRTQRVDLSQGAAALRDRRFGLEAELQRRGFSVAGDQVWKEPSAWRQGAGDFLAASGAGSGSLGTIASGWLLRSMSPGRLAILAAGAIAGKALTKGQDDYGHLVNNLLDAVPLSVSTGVDSPIGIKRQSQADATTSRIYAPGELLRARRMMARAGVYEPGHTADVAFLTGQSPEEEASQVVRLMRLSSRSSPYLSASILGAYRKSAGRDPRRGMDTGLYPSFVGALSTAASSYAGQLTRAPIEDIAAQLSAMTRDLGPGVDPRSQAGYDVAAARLGAMNQFTSGAISSPGALGDISYFAIRQLRGSEVARRLNDELGIDISTPVGIMRAAKRAPELAARGMPEVAEAIHSRFREMYPDQSMREIVALQDSSTGGDPEVAAMVARGDATSVYRARAASGEKLAPRFRAAAATLAQGQEVDDIYQTKVRPETIALTEGWAKIGRAEQLITNEASERAATIAEGATGERGLTEYLRAVGEFSMASQALGGLVEELRSILMSSMPDADATRGVGQ